MLRDQLDRDLKDSLLARDELKVSTLRSLKSALTYATVEARSKGGEGDLSEEQVVTIFAKEAKKRQESADAFRQAGAVDRAEKELAEKAIIENYLPAQLSDDELAKLVDQVLAETDISGTQAMGQVIGKVKAAAGGQADGSRIADFIKERLAS
ncbi:MAG: GatB/YqeY domain-containing protein [Candidatus Saccharimonadales bacterium]